MPVDDAGEEPVGRQLLSCAAGRVVDIFHVWYDRREEILDMLEGFRVGVQVPSRRVKRRRIRVGEKVAGDFVADAQQILDLVLLEVVRESFEVVVEFALLEHVVAQFGTLRKSMFVSMWYGARS